jgi:hypothetical protein
MLRNMIDCVWAPLHLVVVVFFMMELGEESILHTSSIDQFKNYYSIRSEDLVAVIMKGTIILDVTSCSSIEVY